MVYRARFNLWNRKPILRLALLRALGAPEGFSEFSRNLLEVSSSPGSGRYEGKVQSESDNKEFLRAIELDEIENGFQHCLVFDQLDGALPTTPQIEGDALVISSNITVLPVSDNAAERNFINIAMGDFLFSFNQSTYFDDRPDVNLAGTLKRV